MLGSGSLAQAMRASMSVPGAMSPVEIDGRLLVDGAIADNLPIDQARKLCADVVIAVNISTPPLTRKEITSAYSVVSQLLNFLGKQTVDDQLRSLTDKDVLISPDLGDVSAVKFDRSADAIRIGEEATRALADKLTRYSLPPDQYAQLRARQVAEPKALGAVDEIRVEGLAKTNPAVVRELIESKPGEPLSEEKIGADLRRIFGTRDYEGIDYRIVGGDVGPRAMVIAPKEKSWGSDYLRFGIGLASDFQGDNQFNALVQYRKTWLNRLGGEWTTEAQIGQNTHVFTEFYQPLSEEGQWFIAPNGNDRTADARPVRGDDKVANYLISTGEVGVDVGMNLGTWGQLRTGAVWSKVFARVDTGSPRPADGARDDCGTARGALRRPDQYRVVSVGGLRIHRDSLCRNDVVRIGNQLSASRRDCARHSQLGRQTCSTPRSAAARRSGPTCRPTSPSRSEDRCGYRDIASTSSPAATMHSAA